MILAIVASFKLIKVEEVTRHLIEYNGNNIYLGIAMITANHFRE